MKIKVVNIKDVGKYFIKFIIIFSIILVISQFFYSKKDSNNCFALNSTKFLSVLNKEILLFRNNEKLNINIGSNNFIKDTINKEFNMYKAVASNQIVATNGNAVEIEQDNNFQINNEQNKQENTETNNNEQFQEPLTNVTVEVLPSQVSNKYTHDIFGVQLKNESDYNLSEEITDLNVNFNKQDIIMFHTHTCESYTPTEQYQYQASGTFRTTDLNYSVSRVGDELEKYLNNYGYSVVHDKSYHDYPAYTGSYDRSLITVKKLLENNTNTDVVIDLHRDAIGDNTYAPTVKIGDEYCARLMFVIGTDGGGLFHDGWRENLKFAIKLQKKANELYPGLFKPIIVRNSRYNHHVSKAACIIEVGATGNTLEQCLNSMKYLAKIFNEM